MANLLKFEKTPGLILASTFSNTEWGNMRLSDTDAPSKYKRLFKDTKINSNIFIYGVPDHNDNIQILTKENIVSYKYFNKYTESSWINENELIPMSINSDGFLTKESIPIVIAPADCLIIVLSGIDKKDNKRFLCMLHAGLNGLRLGIHKKALDLIQTQCEVNSNDLDVYIFPGIGNNHYSKSKSDQFIGHIFSDPKWESAIEDKNSEEFYVNLEKKLVYDLSKMAIGNINSFNLDTYQENINGNLFSRTYQKEHELPFYNHAVVGVIR